MVPRTRVTTVFTLFIGKGQHFAAGNGGEREKGLYLYTYCVKIDYIHSNKSSSENKFSWHRRLFAYTYISMGWLDNS